jgi:phage terminase large subunit-like protein
LAPDGKMAVLDWARPPGTVRGPLWAATVRAIEPVVALDMLDDGLDVAAKSAGLVVQMNEPLAAGRARAVHLGPAVSG